MRIPTLGRLTLPATGLLAAALAWGVMSAPAHAGVDNPEPTTSGTEAAAAEAATAALDQVQTILEQPADNNRDLTIALRDLRLHQADLTARERATAQRVAPDRPLPDSAPHQDFGSVRVHWAADDAKADPAAVAEVANHVLATYKAAGYRAPMSDGTAGGGSDLFDIYLVDLGIGLYGVTDTGGVPPRTAPFNTSAYVALNSDFSWSTISPSATLKVTTAHELFHAVQFAYDYSEDGWFMEATAAWAEDEVYDSIDDNRQYLSLSPLAQPSQSLDEFSGDLRHYGRWIFFRYLSERFPQAQGGLPVIVRKMWERADSSRGLRYDEYSIQAISKELASRGTDLRHVYAQFGVANRHPGRAYEEGSHYPTAPAQRSWRFTPKHHNTRWQVAKVDHLATQTMQVRPSKAMKRWRVRVIVDLPNRKSGVAAVVTRYSKSGRPTSQSVPLSKTGNGKLGVVFDARKVSRVEVTLSNAGIRYGGCWRGPARNGVTYSCGGTPKDDNRPMRYRITAAR